MTDDYQAQVDKWADGIERKTITPDSIPPASRDAVQVRILQRHKERMQLKLAPAS
jgi:hypothetical protein